MAKRFEQAGIKTASLDARLLLGRALGLDRLRLITNEKQIVTAAQLDELERLAVRRLSGEPVARILGEKEFYGLTFALNEASLVPRPETEMLVDLGREIVGGRDGGRVLDLGAGSGCVGISLALNVAECEVVAVEISRRALEVARINARRHRVDGRVSFVCGSWFEPLGGEQKFDLIISNPPYIAFDEIKKLAPEVARHDPLAALNGGKDGLDCYREIIVGANKHLNGQGELVLEVGHDQGQRVGDLCLRAGFERREEYRDLAGHVRVIRARR